MPVNIFAILVASLFPIAIGFIWYNPAVFGKAWMAASGMTEEKAKQTNMVVVMLVSLVLSFLLAFAIASLAIHQIHIFSLMAGEEGPEVTKYLNDFMAEHGQKYRSFGHGALHGGIGAFTIAVPVLAINSMFDGRGFKYIAINAGYWIVTMALMGGLICAWQ